MRKEFYMSSRLRILLNKMELLRGRTERSLRWQERCLMNTRHRNIFGEKRSRQLVMLSTGFIFISFLARHHMSFSPVTNPKWDTFVSLVQNVISLTSIVGLNLLLNLMKAFSLVMDQTLTPTVSTTISPERLKRR